MATSTGVLSKKIVAGVGIAVLAGCAAPVEELPTVDLSGGPAFPLNAHLESADIAAYLQQTYGA